MAMRWRWPPERLRAALPDQRVVALRQLEDELVRAGQPGRLHHRARAACPGRPSAMFSRTVRLNRKFSCSTTPIWRRSQRARPAPGRCRRSAPGPARARRAAGSAWRACSCPSPDAPDDADDLARARSSRRRRCSTSGALGPIAERSRGRSRSRPRSGGSASRVACARGSAGAFRMSPRRSTETPRLLEVLPQLRPGAAPARHPAGQHVEGDQLAHGQRRRRSPALAPNHSSAARDQLADQAGACADQLPQRGAREAGAHVARQLLLPAPLHLRLHAPSP